MSELEARDRLTELQATEVVAVRLGNTPDWVWSPPETAPRDYYVELLIDAPDGLRRALGIYRKGPFWGREVEGWFAPEIILENGSPTHNMFIDAWVKGWRPYRYHRETEALLTRVRPNGEGWQTIESAPKDGTRFWAWFPQAHEGQTGGMFSVAWEHNVYEPTANWTLDDGESAVLTYDPPTHWMPLPEPPLV